MIKKKKRKKTHIKESRFSRGPVLQKEKVQQVIERAVGEEVK